MRVALVGLVAVALTMPVAAQEPVASPPESDQPAAEPRPKASAFRKLFITLARDIKRLPTKESARLLVNGGMLAAAAHPFDDAATLGASSSEFLKASFSGWGKALGREWVQGGGALAAYVAGRVLDKPTITAVGGDLIEAQLLSVTLTQ